MAVAAGMKGQVADVAGWPLGRNYQVANAPPAPAELRHALAAIDRHVHGYIDDARLGNAA